MRKKILFVCLIWFVAAVAMFFLYLLREVSPLKEFIAWALSVWPLLAALGGIAILISGWIIKHDFGSKKNKEAEVESDGRPTLEVTFKDKFSREHIEGWWLRLRVNNSGGSTARECGGKITKFFDNKGHQINYDPQPLHWIKIPWESADPFGNINLRKSEKDFLDILVQKASDSSKVFLFTPPLYHPKPLDWLKQLPTGTCRMQVTVYSENADPCIKEFDIEWEDNSHSYKSLILKESPSDKEVSQS